MATVTISGGTGDAGALGDNDPWKLWAASYQSDGEGGVITTRSDREANILRPVGGFLKFEVEAGITAYLESPNGTQHLVNIPEVDASLWSLVEASIAYPPNTPQQLLDNAVGAYVEEHRDEFSTRAVLIESGPNAGLYQWMDVNDDPVGDPVELSEIVNVSWAGLTGEPLIQPKARTRQAVVCFTFDDCPVEDFTVIKPILDGKGIKGGFAFPSGWPGLTGRMTWGQVKQLQDEGHEIIAHSITHSPLDTFKDPDMSLVDTTAEINNKAAYEAHDIHPRGFAYPAGQHNATLRKIVRDYWDYGLALGPGASGSQSPLWTYAIRRLGIADSTVTATHHTEIDTAIANSEILMYIVHADADVGQFTSGGGGYARLADVIQYCLDEDVLVVTPGEAFDLVRNVVDSGDPPAGEGFAIDGAGNFNGRVLPHATDALTKPPSAFLAGVTLQGYELGDGAPGAGPGGVETIIVSPGVGSAKGGFNQQRYMRNAGLGLYIRHGLVDNSGWTAWRAYTPQLTDSASAISTVPSAYVAGITIQNVLAPASPDTPSGGAGVLRTVITIAGAAAVGGFLNYQEFVGISAAGTWIRNSLSDNSAWSTWKRVDVEGGLAPVIHAATAKVTPVANDEFALVDSAASNVLKRIKYSDVLAAISGVVGPDPDGLTSGESTISRRAINSTITLTSQFLRLSYFTAKKTETIASVRTTVAGTASGTPTLCRVGVYSVDVSGNLTLIASTVNDTAMWATINTTYTKAFASSWSKVAGTRYVVGVLFVGTTAPLLHGIAGFSGDELAIAPRLSAGVVSQADLPSSVLVGSLSVTSLQTYAALIP